MRGEDWEPANFVYDADTDELLEIFAVSAEGAVDVDKVCSPFLEPSPAPSSSALPADIAPLPSLPMCLPEYQELASKLDSLGVGYKTTRGDRPTALVVQENAQYGMQRLGMTRSLGDFYMQYHGCTFEPSVSCIDLFDLVTQLAQVTVILASDGLWDIWAYKDVLKVMTLASGSPLRNCFPRQHVSRSLSPHAACRRSQDPLKDTEPDANNTPLAPITVQATLSALVEETRKETADMFGDTADNISAICVAFDSISPK